MRKATLSLRWPDKEIGHGAELVAAIDPSAHRYSPLDYRTRYPALSRWSVDPRYERADVVARLGKPIPNEREGIPTNGEANLSELLRLGVLKAREDGALDIPDIYRDAFEIAPDYATAWGEFLKAGDTEVG